MVSSALLFPTNRSFFKFLRRRRTDATESIIHTVPVVRPNEYDHRNFRRKYPYFRPRKTSSQSVNLLINSATTPDIITNCHVDVEYSRAFSAAYWRLRDALSETYLGMKVTGTQVGRNNCFEVARLEDSRCLWSFGRQDQDVNVRLALESIRRHFV